MGKGREVSRGYRAYPIVEQRGQTGERLRELLLVEPFPETGQRGDAEGEEEVVEVRALVAHAHFVTNKAFRLFLGDEAARLGGVLALLEGDGLGVGPRLVRRAALGEVDLLDHGGYVRWVGGACGGELLQRPDPRVKTLGREPSRIEPVMASPKRACLGGYEYDIEAAGI